MYKTYLNVRVAECIKEAKTKPSLVALQAESMAGVKAGLLSASNQQLSQNEVEYENKRAAKAAETARAKAAAEDQDGSQGVKARRSRKPKAAAKDQGTNVTTVLLLMRRPPHRASYVAPKPVKGKRAPTMPMYALALWEDGPGCVPVTVLNAIQGVCSCL